MTVRSTRLGAVHGVAATYVSIFVCPAGWRTILKSANVDNAGGSATNITVLLQTAGGGLNANLAIQALAANSVWLWQGWAVMNPGDTLFVYSSASVFDAWASGTLLQLTGNEPV